MTATPAPFWQAKCAACNHRAVTPHTYGTEIIETWHCLAVRVGANPVYCVTARTAQSRAGRCGREAVLFYPRGFE